MKIDFEVLTLYLKRILFHLCGTSFEQAEFYVAKREYDRQVIHFKQDFRSHILEGDVVMLEPFNDVTMAIFYNECIPVDKKIIQDRRCCLLTFSYDSFYWNVKREYFKQMRDDDQWLFCKAKNSVAGDISQIGSIDYLFCGNGFDMMEDSLYVKGINNRLALVKELEEMYSSASKVKEKEEKRLKRAHLRLVSNN